MYHFYMKPAELNLRGFTLVELMIVVGIMILLTGFLLPNFTSYIDSQNLNVGADKVIVDLRAAQSRALAGVEEDGLNTFWGVKFFSGADQYVFSTTTEPTDYSAACAAITLSSGEKRQPLKSSVVIKNSADTCVFFSFDNGNAFSATGMNIYLGDADAISGGTCKLITVNAVGLVKDEGVVACP